jgi:hypothetical protein
MNSNFFDDNNNEYSIPNDAEILKLILDIPELLKENNYIKKRYNIIIKNLNKLTLSNYDICFNDIAIS